MSIDRLKVKLPPHVRMDCYRTALFPILEYYNADPNLLMISSDAKFSYENELKCDEERCYQYNDIFRDFNIERVSFEILSNIWYNSMHSITRKIDKPFRKGMI